MSKSIRIRDARGADTAALAAFNVAMAMETENKKLDLGRVQRGVSAVLEQAQRGLYLVAELDAIVVGCLLVTHEWSDWRCADWWWIQSVYVVPPARGNGVFRALHAQVEERARMAPEVAGLRLYVERENIGAQRTYAALGMHETAYRIYETEFSGDRR